LVGRLKYPWYFALWEGAKTTINGLTGIVSGLYQLFAGHLGFASLGGPVKIAKLTGEVAGLGLFICCSYRVSIFESRRAQHPPFPGARRWPRTIFID